MRIGARRFRKPQCTQYTARYVYGHPVGFSRIGTTQKSAETIRSEVQSIAKSRYNAKTKNPSQYGEVNAHEYIAESYAGLTGGIPVHMTRQWVIGQSRTRRKAEEVFTSDGRSEYEKYKQWISDENYDFSPNFVPTEDTPKEAIEYYKSIESMVVDFDDPNFTWPTGIGMCC